MGTIARTFADVCIKRPRSFYTYEKITIEWGDVENYEAVRKIGRGKYSEVFLGRNVVNGRKVVIKVLKPVKTKKIKREISILQSLHGGVNIIKLYDVVRDPTTGTPALIFEAVDNTDFKVLYPQLTDLDARYYLYQLLRALHFAHSEGIIHRDVKPQNIMIDHAQRKLRLIDWGLAEYYLPGFCFNVRVASRFFKSIELLVGHQDYGAPIDLWAVGCVMGGLIFLREPLFRGADNQDQLLKIVQVLGTDGLYEYVDKYGLELDAWYVNKLRPTPKRPWSKFVNSDNRHFYSDEAIDLLDSLLYYDPVMRPTAAEAMAHPYFDPVRDAIEAEAAAETAADSEPASSSSSSSAPPPSAAAVSASSVVIPMQDSS